MCQLDILVYLNITSTDLTKLLVRQWFGRWHKCTKGTSGSEPLAQAPKDFGRIAPWISKDSARSTFKTVSEVSYNNEFHLATSYHGAYPLSASITRYYVNQYLTSSMAELTLLQI